MTLVFATCNNNKLIEVQRILGPDYKLILPSDLGYDEDIPETHFTIKDNAIEKASFVWDRFHQNCFADDTGLCVDYLNGAPGVFTARYAGEPKNPVENVKKILREMEGVPFEKRTARFVCDIAYIDRGDLYVFEGTCEGHISFEPQGELGFGYDPVFIPEGMDRTMAMLSLAEKNAISHRGDAIKKLLCHLTENRS
ncbi:MAG: RdgB/HAM1 family non-canonical purine NTP pyrophosphatase [Bacteroidales bacterium]|nr:RdgB/HAM1 family non-canonical purine NTP pyrophosphatase [Bacteroidales bacterium]